MNTARRRSSRNHRVDEMIPLSTCFVKHPLYPGVSCVKSGKWVAKICHPVRKVWVCVGIYATSEEAADAYTAKKTEYESHSQQQETDPFSHTNVADLEEPYTGVCRGSSGKWRAAILHDKVTVSLGSYNTPKEAAYAYHMSKLELDSHGKGDSPHGSSAMKVSREEETRGSMPSVCVESVPLLDTEETKAGAGVEQSEKHQRPRCVYPRKSGRWQSEIRHPITKDRIYLGGNFETAEEARKAYDRKKRELDLMVRDHNKVGKQSNSRCKATTTSEGRRDLTCVSGGPSVSTRFPLGTLTDKAEEAYKADCSSNSARVSNDPPITGRSYHLDAEDVYTKNMCEFDLMVRVDKKRKQPNASCEADAISQGKSDAYSKMMYEFELMVRADNKDNAVVEDKNNSTDRISVTNVNVESVPLLLTEERVKFDMGVIDSYGRLIGEYSTLDDELRIY